MAAHDRLTILLMIFSLAFGLVHAAPLSLTPRQTTSSYNLIADYSGDTFFNNFDVFDGTDPTHGFVSFVNIATAASNEYLKYLVRDDNAVSAYIGVDNTTQTPAGRPAVRLTSKQTFSVGSLFVLDLAHAPVAYGTWPAAWLLGTTATWPAAGEIDILEWVHETPYNTMTLHTGPGCEVSNTSAATTSSAVSDSSLISTQGTISASSSSTSSDTFLGTMLQTNCNAGSGNLGCGITAPQITSSSSTLPATAGTAFNTQNGGVYVTEWTTTGITIWLFSHSTLPSDLASSSPDPSSWTQEPLARFSGSGCDYATAFEQMQFIFDITFCGDWAGQAAVWDGDAKAATGAATCVEWVAGNPAAFDEAYFEVSGLRVYSSSGSSSRRGVLENGDEASVEIAKVKV